MSRGLAARIVAAVVVAACLWLWWPRPEEAPPPQVPTVVADPAAPRATPVVARVRVPDVPEVPEVPEASITPPRRVAEALVASELGLGRIRCAAGDGMGDGPWAGGGLRWASVAGDVFEAVVPTASGAAAVWPGTAVERYRWEADHPHGDADEVFRERFLVTWSDGWPGAVGGCVVEAAEPVIAEIHFTLGGEVVPLDALSLAYATCATVDRDADALRCRVFPGALVGVRATLPDDDGYRPMRWHEAAEVMDVEIAPIVSDLDPAEHTAPEGAREAEIAAALAEETDDPEVRAALLAIVHEAAETTRASEAAISAFLTAP